MQGKRRYWTFLKVKVSVYKDSVTIPMGTMTDDRIEILKTRAKDAAKQERISEIRKAKSRS